MKIFKTCTHECRVYNTEIWNYSKPRTDNIQNCLQIQRIIEVAVAWIPEYQKILSIGPTNPTFLHFIVISGHFIANAFSLSHSVFQEKLRQSSNAGNLLC